MKKIVTLIILSVTIVTAFSQNTTSGSTLSSGVTNKYSVLVVPFESKMYLSDIDRDLALKNAMNFQDIKAKFRAALDQNIFIALKTYYNPLSFYAIELQESKKELAYIYNSIGFKYEVIPEEEVVKKESMGTKLIGKFKKKEKEDEYVDAGIQNGQVVSQVDNREKYMKTTISNNNLLVNLNKKHQAKYYIFINELDIKRNADKRYVASEEQYQREIKVHYTIFDVEGNDVGSGAVKARFPSGQNDIDKIIKTHFPLIAQKIVSKLPGFNIAEVK